MIDHLVYATPNVEATCAEIERDWGVRPMPGGKHTGRGTHNALVGLGDAVYFEIIGPDPEQPEPSLPRSFGIDGLALPHLTTWAAKAPGIQERVAAARAAGYDPGSALPMERATPDGQVLRWKLTRAPEMAAEGLVPFLIDWGDSPHPSTTAPKGCRLITLVGEHPAPETVAPLLEALGVELRLKLGPAPALVATIATPRGIRELR